ncbi:hypothetical protein UFOVP600_7 [uncultured Caudovirales phage]|uniref:Uncharacterized protein n=1 Tax=uncultured Caudovirales phage TaxID=2100421 RepID=A0A6J5MX90_9CAUD|nr:hypothetical protein UFOVP600_7 [uncultured Caudovirales phage]
MNELIINNRRVDLSETTNIGLTFCANNIGELQNRQGNFTNTFKIPITKTNKEIFEWSHLQTSSSLIPYTTLKATYKQNGIEIISDGLAEITNVDNNYYYVNVYSGNLDFMGAIGDIIVGDLYKNDPAYAWGLGNNFFDSTDYFIYPLISWREDVDFFSTNTVDVRQTIPCAKISHLFDRLSTYTGFNFTGNYLNSEDYKAMFLTPNNFTIPKIQQGGINDISRNYDVDSGYVSIVKGNSITVINYKPPFIKDNFTFTKDGVFSPTQSLIGTLTYSGKVFITWDFNESIPPFYSAKKRNIFFKVKIVDELNNIIKEVLTTTVTDTVVNFRNKNPLTSFDLFIETSETTFTAGKSYKIIIEANVSQHDNVATKFKIISKAPILSYGQGISFENKNDYFFTPSPKIAFGSTIDFTKIFTMKVKDVIKDILNLRAIIIQTNNYTKTISFNSFEDINLNKAISKDWNNKLQNSTSMSFKFENYAKKNNFLFKEDVDKINNADFNDDYSLLLNNQNLNDEKTVVKLAHPTTIRLNKYNGYIIPYVRGLKDSTNEWLKADWRLLYLKLQNTNFDVNFTNGTTTILKNENIQFCDIIGFQTLVPKYYQTIKGILENPKVIKIVAKLDITDISDLDFSIPIQIQRPDLNLSGYFYINKIENYKGNLTSCEIIEI